jgi:hypothetical protein
MGAANQPSGNTDGQVAKQTATRIDDGALAGDLLAVDSHWREQDEEMRWRLKTKGGS